MNPIDYPLAANTLTSTQWESTTIFERVDALAKDFATRAAIHDKEASFPFENFTALHEAGLLS